VGVGVNIMRVNLFCCLLTMIDVSGDETKKKNRESIRYSVVFSFFDLIILLFRIFLFENIQQLDYL